MYNGWIDLNVRATLKDWEQVVHSLFECSFFPLFFKKKKIVDSQSSLHMKTQRVLKIEEIPWFHPKSIIFKSQRVESGIYVHCKSFPGDSNLQPGLGKSAWDRDSLLPCVKTAFLSLIFLSNDYETIYELVRLWVSHEQYLYEIIK